jgi:CheY-like chemotaxis protein
MVNPMTDPNTLPTILIVDDIESNVQLIVYAIRGLEVNIITANSGSEALQKTNGRDLALALIDMEMPHMGGAGVGTAHSCRPHTRPGAHHLCNGLLFS